jgi:hypothetical protein
LFKEKLSQKRRRQLDAILKKAKKKKVLSFIFFHIFLILTRKVAKTEQSLNKLRESHPEKELSDALDILIKHLTKHSEVTLNKILKLVYSRVKMNMTPIPPYVQEEDE